MCIAILNSPNNLLPKSYVKNSFESNPDGTGFIWVEDGKLMTYKLLTNGYKKPWQIYRKIRERVPNSYIVLHFRIATSGKVDITNCHPFTVNESLAFVHNGIISGLGGLHQSDTYEFNQKYLQKLPTQFTENEAIMSLIGTSIGHSKLVFLDETNRPLIVNEDMGHYDENGNWFSNSTYKDYYDTYNTSYYSKNYGYYANKNYSKPSYEPAYKGGYQSGMKLNATTHEWEWPDTMLDYDSKGRVCCNDDIDTEMYEQGVSVALAEYEAERKAELNGIYQQCAGCGQHGYLHFVPANNEMLCNDCENFFK
jgi:predicted glutamine amidotransferase